MYIYVAASVLASIIAGIIIAACSKRVAGVTYNTLDNVGVITNFALIPTYILGSPLCMFLASLFCPAYEGFWGIIGWIVSFIGASGPALCALGLGWSVSLRRKGKSKASFCIQFAGVAGLLLTLAIFFLFYGNLLDTLN